MINMHYLKMSIHQMRVHFGNYNLIIMHNHDHFLRDNIQSHQYKINYLIFKGQMLLSFFMYRIGN
jgi:hypothetical protein